MNPEALASVVQELRREAGALQVIIAQLSPSLLTPPPLGGKRTLTCNLSLSRGVLPERDTHMKEMRMLIHTFFLGGGGGEGRGDV